MGAIIRTTKPLEQGSVFLELLSPTSGSLDVRSFQVIAIRAQASAMIRHDHMTALADDEWSAFFIESMVEFLVWSQAPAGRLTSDDLDWIVAEIGAVPSPNMPALLFALVRALNDVPERLIALALRYSGNRRAALH